MLASESGHLEVVRLLPEAGAATDRICDDCKTGLALVREKGHSAIRVHQLPETTVQLPSDNSSDACLNCQRPFNTLVEPLHSPFRGLISGRVLGYFGVLYT